MDAAPGIIAISSLSPVSHTPLAVAIILTVPEKSSAQVIRAVLVAVLEILPAFELLNDQVTSRFDLKSVW